MPTKLRRRDRSSPLPAALARCLCISASLVCTGAALLGLGLSCVLLPHLDPSSAGCPRPMAAGAFGGAGALLAGALVAALVVCRGTKQTALMEEMPLQVVSSPTKEMSEVQQQQQDGERPGVVSNGETYEMNQISAEVSQWIEQQEDSALPAPSESFCLEIADGETSHQPQHENSEGEMTAL